MLTPSYLEIEITENFIFENYDEVIKKMTLLRKRESHFPLMILEQATHH